MQYSRKIFHKRYEERYTWAINAYNEFIQKLERSIRVAFERKDQITVVLYGHTQAGKTTVLLRLLGIKDKYYDSVSTVLRGGRPEGNSATATATVYTKSPFPTWSLTGSDNKEIKDLTNEGMLARLTEIRGKVNEGTYEKVDAIHVAIPECYFDPTPFDKVGFQIIDLPGTCCENENERRLVAKIANEYVPYADMVLIVNDAAKMTYLQPENMVSAALSTWYIQPERFHLILTKSFSLSSVKEAFAEKRLSDAESIRKHLLKELRHTLKPNCPPEDADHFLFPVDCGKSWQTLKKTEPAYFKQIEPIINEFFQRLTEEIIGSATPIGRVRMAGSAKSLAEKTKKTRMADYEKRIADIQKKIDFQDEKLAFLDIKIEENAKDLSSYRKMKYEILAPFEQETGYPHMIGKCVRSKPPPLEEKPGLSNVKKYLDGEKEKLKKIIKEYGALRNGSETKPDGLDDKLNLPHLDEHALNQCWIPLNSIDEKELGGGIIFMGNEKYLTPTGYKKDCETVSKASQESFERLRNEISGYLDLCEKGLNLIIGGLESKEKDYNYFRNKEEMEKSVFDKEKEYLVNEKNRFSEDIEQTIELASRFYDYLDSKYLMYYKEQTEVLHKSKNPFFRFYHLCYLKILQQTRRDIVSPQKRQDRFSK